MTTELVLRELDACRTILLKATADEWARPTPCEGWDVEGLARHLAGVAWQQAESFHRARIGVGEAPSWLGVEGDRAHLLDVLATAREHLAPALAAVGEHATVPLAFAPLPTPIAVAALVLEYGVHRHDLERALGKATDIDLDAEVGTVVAGLTPALVPLLAEKPPAAPITYRLHGDTATVAITWRDDAWHADGDDAPTVCEVRGSDTALALLALGRIGGEHPALRVEGAVDAASALSDHIRNL